jgi:hypothetical protein
MFKPVLLTLPAVLLLTSCAGKGKVKQVSSENLSSFKVLQESKFCVLDSCLSFSILKGPDGNDYLKVDYTSKGIKERGFWDLCNLTELRQGIQKEGKGSCTATDYNWALRFPHYVRFRVNYGTGFPKSYSIYIAQDYRGSVLGDEFHIRLSDYHVKPIIGGLGIHYDDGRIRVYTIKRVPWKYGKYHSYRVYTNSWVDLRPYIFPQKKSKK